MDGEEHEKNNNEDVIFMKGLTPKTPFIFYY
jgi:hypothetical protein